VKPRLHCHFCCHSSKDESCGGSNYGTINSCYSGIINVFFIVYA